MAQSKPSYLLKYEDDTSSRYGYKTPKGKIIIPAKYIMAEDTLRSVGMVCDTGGWKMIDRNERVILIPFIYDNGPDYLEENVFRFVENQKIGFATEDGKKVIPAQFDFATQFSDGISEFTLGGHKQYEPGGEHWYWADGDEFGYINHSGQRFIKVTELKNNRRKAWTKDGKVLILNSKGNIVNK